MKTRTKILIGLLIGLLIIFIGAGAYVFFVFGDKSESFYENQVAAIEERYASGYPQGGVLLVGSSVMERWETFDTDLDPLDAENVGIGGTKVQDQVYNFDRLVLPFQPRAVVVYIGSNDINGIPFLSKDGETTADAVIAYLDLIQEHLPQADIYYIAICEAPSKSGSLDEIQTANRIISAHCDTDARLTFLDVNPALKDREGNPDQSLYISDHLHLNEAGYRNWSSIISPVLLEEQLEHQLEL
ncbi:MAG: GDSL-type esterase/lipase family protein [Clostridiales bacterium]|nr:GDSL-type esterase/lipase family protein [Clostridiales bacterium]